LVMSKATLKMKLMHCLKFKGRKFKLALHELYTTHLKASDSIEYSNSL